MEDFKTGDVQTEEEGGACARRESLQFDVYALAWLRTKGRLPDRVELRFLESGLAAGRQPTREEVGGHRDAYSPRRRRAFAGASSRLVPPGRACGQCPFRDICPHTARSPEGEA